MLFVYQHLIGRAEEMQQESQGKRHSPRKRGASNDLLVYFLNMPSCYQQTASFLNQAGTKHFNEIKIPIFFLDFF